MLNRRKLLKTLSASAVSPLIPLQGKPETSAISGARSKYTYCLNMATLRGHKLGFMKELEIAAKADFRSVEIWLDTLQEYLDAGGSIAEVRKRLDGFGIKVENAIGFAEWIVDDDTARKMGIAQMKREMDLLAQIGCKRIAAPPAGATDVAGLDLKKIAERYRVILEMGDQTGVVPQLEIWGFSKNISRTSEALYVAIESGHPSARVLPDIFHLYKGGSSTDTLALIGKPAVEIIHINDYPANISAAAITDADRIHPGDGVAPIQRILKILQHPDRPLILSEEVFNQYYYSQDALEVARTALNKMKAVTKD